MLENLVRDNIKKLSPYSSARDEFKKKADIYMDANENPFENGLNRYPDPYQIKVKEEISKWKEIPIENMVLGNGSDEILDLIFRVFCEPKEDNVILLPPTYGMYKVLAEINNVSIKEVALKKDFTIDIDTILSSEDDNSKLLFICSPNNPSSNVFSIARIEELLNNFRGIIVIDEAYIDFSKEESWIKRLREFPRLIVTQTFSKALGHAGIRLGMMFASEEICTLINKVKPPYNVNTLTQNKAIELLKNPVFKDQVELLKVERAKLISNLNELEFISEVYPSDANFILIKVDDAKLIYNKLLDEGIVVRDRSTLVNCENTLRISVGTPKENEQLVDSLKTFSI